MRTTQSLLIDSLSSENLGFYQHIREGIGDHLHHSLKTHTLSVLNFRPTPQSDTKFEFQVRLADLQDQHLVDRWYQEFNKEENSNWSTPELKKLSRLRHYLIFSGNDFVGGASNSIQNEKRFRVGRLYTFKEWRRKGTRNALMEHLEKIAHVSNQSVDLHVNLNNPNAIQFYQKRGYQVQSENAYWILKK